MRLVMLAPFGIRPKGTLAARMLPLAQALVRRGHQVTILAPPVLNPQDAGQRLLLGGVLVQHTGLPRLAGPAAALEQALALLRPALAAAPDLLHLFKPKGFGGLAALAARALRPQLPLVLDTDDWEGPGGWNDLLPYPASAKALFAWQERDLPRRAAAVTVASETLRRQVLGFGIPPERVFHLPNGSEAARPPESAAARVGATILLYTRFWEFCLPELVAALAGIHSRRPDATLLVVGQGERGEERELARLMAQAGLAGMLDARGWVQPEAIPPLLAQADLALVPAADTLINRARCSAKLLELLGAGLPVVASRVGAVGGYLEHGVSGWLVPPGDAGALAAGALALLDDPVLRARLAEGGQAAAWRWRWDALAPLAEAAYYAAQADQ